MAPREAACCAQRAFTSVSTKGSISSRKSTSRAWPRWERSSRSGKGHVVASLRTPTSSETPRISTASPAYVQPGPVTMTSRRASAGP